MANNKHTIWTMFVASSVKMQLVWSHLGQGNEGGIAPTSNIFKFHVFFTFLDHRDTFAENKLLKLFFFTQCPSLYSSVLLFFLMISEECVNKSSSEDFTNVPSCLWEEPYCFLPSQVVRVRVRYLWCKGWLMGIFILMVKRNASKASMPLCLVIVQLLLCLKKTRYFIFQYFFAYYSIEGFPIFERLFFLLSSINMRSFISDILHIRY